MSIKFNEVKEKLKSKKYTWLVTGCAGFIGSNLVEDLLKLNQKVVGLDNFSTGLEKNIEDIQSQVGSELYKNFTFVDGDIQNLETCKKVCEGVDYILHQAALGSVPRSIEDPLSSHQSNVNGHLNILWAAKNQNVKRVVYASSSSVYGDHPDLPKQELAIGKQLSPYAVTKYINELYSEVFGKCYGVENIGIRYFNVFGKRQDPNSVYAAVMPKWIKAMMNNQNVEIYGDGETSRDFCYISNVVQMNILAATTENKNAINKVFNCACHDRTNLNDLYKAIRDNMKSYYSYLEDAKPIYKDFRAGDVRHSFADINMAKDLLGYDPTHMFNEGLVDSLEWYRNNL